MVQSLIQGFEDVQFENVMRLYNRKTNEMAQATSGLRISERMNERIIKIQKRHLPTVVAWLVDILSTKIEKFD